MRPLAGCGGAGAKTKEIIKEELSEYFLYTVEGRDTIPTGWGKRLPSFKTTDVPITSYYKFEKERWGDQVMRYYRFTNSVPSHLGKEPLPDGAVKAFRIVTDDNLYAFVGSTAVKYIPVNETVELELGNDREVLVKPTLMNWVKTDLAFDDNGQRERLDDQGDVADRGAELQGHRRGAGHPAQLQRRLDLGDRRQLREGGREQGEVPPAAQGPREAPVQLRGDDQLRVQRDPLSF